MHQRFAQIRVRCVQRPCWDGALLPAKCHRLGLVGEKEIQMIGWRQAGVMLVPYSTRGAVCRGEMLTVGNIAVELVGCS